MVYEGVRVDMGELAKRVGVGRATLYRWFGSREGLLEGLLERFALLFLEQARAQARGEGDAWVLDVARRLMQRAVEFEPARRFVAREPQLALRLLLGAGGAVHRALSRALREALADVHSGREMAALEQSVEPMVQVATALQWATFAIGDEPQIERAVELMGLMLSAAREGGDGRG
jgi:AcrR family transcriptional regulator